MTMDGKRLMPNVTVVTPAAVVPADRLTLDATNPRGGALDRLAVPLGGMLVPLCMADE